jgi:peptidoglycan/xylan/chitin deacetylase (PgdA/CDA1 family)
MAPRIKGRHGAPRPGIGKRIVRLAAETAIAAIFVGIVLFKIFSYLDPSALTPSSVSGGIARAFHNASSLVGHQSVSNTCPDGFEAKDVPGGHVCAQGPVTSVYGTIYRTYPLAGDGRESIYSSTDQGSLSEANDLLRNQYDIPQYAPLRLSGLPTWSEDPYGIKDWRFQFYSLRPSLNLLYAFRTTGNAAYAKKLVAVDLSFIAAEPKSHFAWSDPHAVALRALALVDTWWQLRQSNQLSEQASTAILTELEKTGQFLAEDNNYQAGNSNTIDEAAALYEISVALPALPHAPQWLALGKQRFQWQLDGLVDTDGQLIDNSSYDDFSALQKYAEIYYYSVAQKSLIASDFRTKLTAMTRFATYTLQPNSQVPLLGASIETTINDHGVFQQLGEEDPQLNYVLTHGAKGTAPAQQSVYFPSSALTVMRSDWQSGTNFSESTYLTYNIGKYRTAHSSLDALAITLYGDGGDLLPGPGLYSSDPGAYRNYFHGTASENTVVVDGKSQVQGNGTATSLMTIDGLTYQSAESSLYEGVTHQRMVMMIDKDHILVVDRLNSDSAHDYQQMFHLFPGAQLSQSGLTVTGTGGTPRRQVTIQQLQPQGITESAVINERGAKPAGLCSQKYGQLVPCYQIAYTVHGKSAEFITLITVGKPQAPAASVSAGADGQHLTITEGEQRFAVNLGQSAAKPMQARATNPVPPPAQVIPVTESPSPANWTIDGSATLDFRHVQQLGNAVVPRLTTSSTSPSSLVNNTVQMNLLRNNARLSIEVEGYARLRNFQLVVSNGHWTKTATLDLFNSVQRTQEGDWVTLFLGPSAQWGPRGGWSTSALGFDWSAIDGLEIKAESKVSGGQPSTVSVGSLSLIPEQSMGKIAIVFDDGYQSILPAANYMHQNGIPGNVAVIGKYVDYPTLDHLNVSQLKELQNAWGWNMVNHTQQHVDAVTGYYDQNNQEGYARDILQQAAWLEQNGLNSAPNWFIYPHGDTNSDLEGVVSQYYMFARVTQNDPEAYPYGDPHTITNLEIQYPGDGGDGGSTGTTTPAEIDSAINQAIAYHSTLILTFHRIKSVPSDPAGYPLALFKQTVDEIKQSGIQVMTLSQLDQSNGIPLTNHIYYQPEQPSQITVQIEALGANRPTGPSIRWIVALAVGVLILALVLGFALWTRFHRNGPGSAATGGAGDKCAPLAVSTAGTRADRYDQQVLSLKPVLYLPLDDPASSIATDLSRDRHMAVYRSGGRRLGTARLPNGDLTTVFDGEGQYVEVPSSKELSISNTGCLTIEAWVRPDVLQFPHEQGSGYVYILGKGTSGKEEYAMRMYSLRNSEVPPRPNRISAYVFNLSGGLGSGAYFQDEVRPGEWMMVTFVIDSRPSGQWPDGYITIYKDGVSRGGPVSLRQFNVVPQASDAPFRVGTRDLESFFQGAIGKVAVYDTVLSDQEIIATYQAMVPARS